MTSRYPHGGLEPRFHVTRTDGKPCRPEARYVVLDISGADPHARRAIAIYAASVEAENPAFARDLYAALADPAAAPPQHG